MVVRENHGIIDDEKQKNLSECCLVFFQVKMFFRLKDVQPYLIPNFQKKLY